ncbi:tellurite resistance protein TerC [Kribbella sp. VKM Ac-2527]|uniref:Tellurite resistance protein TerC n=1 Tax=Kribbella caucasensis TaxID=2512215 RepID=A0A4R6KKI1_9ACTN|nr:TerC family protein [Kribbella sp. VKM Ac-2527]TDO50086.1 tellurite resistance protein TerC [Kribbella sp. VKM Ac-2527]
MHVHDYVWYITVGLMLAVLAFDVFIIGRRPHEPSTRESATAIAVYVGLAIVFGLGIWAFSGGQYAGEFFAGWLTEYSLSVDNLFIFLIIMSRFQVPRKYQQTALLIGIILALVFRGIFIAVGAAAINQFSWVFYLFGAFLVYTAIHLAMQGENDDEDYKENAVIRFARRHLNASDEYNGVKLTVIKNGKRLVTPMAIVIVALGTTDLLFALDSIPAIYGLTQEPFLVFTANVFALMGLRQLYFLLGDLLRRLIYLSLGLSVVLAFIGVKLVLHAMHENELPFINGGHHIEWAPEIPIWVSLTFIIITLGITTVASLYKSRNLAAAEAKANGQESAAAAAGGGELDEATPIELDPATRAELEDLQEPQPEQTDSKKA